jgi:bacterioferritin-associated ferredoxin
VIERRDLAIIGAGPAGLAAATLGAELGLDTVLVDEQAGPGGQIYRGIEQFALLDGSVLGPDYRRGYSLALALRRTRAAYLDQAIVWQVRADRRIRYSRKGEAREIEAGRVVLATGAIERPFPIPGWTLPGVMTAGAGQTLMKTAGLVPEGGVVLAGLGPLVWQLAQQYARAGVPITAILETVPRDYFLRAAPLLPWALTAGDEVRKGLGLIRAVKRSGTRIERGVTGLRALGGKRLEAVEFTRGGRAETIPTPLLLLHQGVVPDANLVMSIGCRHTWDEGQLCWRPALDEWGRTDVDGIAVAGDGAGIGGARAAEHTGRLAALDAAHALGRIERAARDRQAAPAHAALRRLRRLRPFLEALYRPPDWSRRPAEDAVLACRCEEVTAGEVRAAAGQGCANLNALKSLTRCGMGPCQGRLCGPTAAELLAGALGVATPDVGTYRLRPPVKPVALADILAFADGTVPPEAATPTDHALAAAQGDGA